MWSSGEDLKRAPLRVSSVSLKGIKRCFKDLDPTLYVKGPEPTTPKRAATAKYSQACLGILVNSLMVYQCRAVPSSSYQIRKLPASCASSEAPMECLAVRSYLFSQAANALNTNAQYVPHSSLLIERNPESVERYTLFLRRLSTVPSASSNSSCSRPISQSLPLSVRFIFRS